ncbi:MAG: hypothetical protein LBU84_07645 [Prevotella sp.]|jgi:hypothetical protein|nr:hypothetical protein [Prevotella sp.]
MITLEYYYFLTNVVGCAYKGKVEGLGTVMTLPVTVANTTTASSAVNRQGIYLTTNYIPIIVPDPPQANDPVREYEAEQYVKGKISRTNRDGSIDYLDASTGKVHKLEKGGYVNVDIYGDNISIYAKDSTHIFELTSDLNLYMEQLEKAPTFFNFSGKVPEVPLPPQKRPYPAGKTTYDVGGLAWSYFKWKTMDAKYKKGRWSVINGDKREKKIKKIHDAKQHLKRKHGIKIKTQTSKILDETLPAFYKGAGRVIFRITIFLELLNIYENRAFKASHALDGVMIAVAAIPYFGWIISLAYFLTDVSIMAYNYKKTGNAKGIGDYLNEWVDKKGWFENGVIWDLSPILGHPDNNKLPIIGTGKTISF